MTDIEIDDRLERILWRSIGVKSVRQVSDETGLTIEDVARIRRQLVESVDEISIDQKRMKLLVDLQEIADIARADYNDETDKDKGSKLLTASIGAIKTVLQELARIEKASSGAVEALNAMRVQELLRLIDLTVAKTFAVLTERHGIPEDEMYDIFQSYMKPTAEELDR